MRYSGSVALLSRRATNHVLHAVENYRGQAMENTLLPTFTGGILVFCGRGGIHCRPTFIYYVEGMSWVILGKLGSWNHSVSLLLSCCC
jgi:hypothetical protein